MDTEVEFKVGDKVRRIAEFRDYPHGRDVMTVTKVQPGNIILDDGKPGWMPRYFELVEPSATLKQVGGDHYRTLAIQPVDYITQNKLDWCEGNIVKYITRWKQKGGVDDIKKVIHYAELLLGMQK